MSRRRLALLSWLLIGCDTTTSAPTARPAAPTVSASPSAEADAEALLESLAAAEAARDTKAIHDHMRRHSSARVRAHAARALARIADPPALDRLAESLSDADPDVVAWSAYGLGYGCRGREEATVGALVSRAASLAAEPAPEEATAPSRFALRPTLALASALARCSSPAAERTLVAWARAGGDRGADALRALGKLASRGRLADDTLDALLTIASEAGPLRPAALAPFGYVTSIDAAAEARLLDVAQAAIEAGGAPRSAAVGALGAAGESAASLLLDVLLEQGAQADDRAEAARRLGHLGLAGQNALRQAVTEVARAGGATPSPLERRALEAAIGELHPPAPGISATLERLSELAPEHDSGSVDVGRLSRIRCSAASVLAGTASLSDRLVHCDLGGGDVGALAVVDVLGRGPLDGSRGARWESFADHASPRVAIAALSLLATHPEAPRAPDHIAAALGRAEPGVVATAARLVLDHPHLVTEASDDPEHAGPGKPHAGVLAALAHALDHERPADQIHTRGMLLRASARLGALSVKARAELDCRSHHPTVRRHAELALSMLGGAGARCPEPTAPVAPAPAPGARSEPVHLTFVTERERLGMTLNPDLAPRAVERLVDLARSGFFDGMRIHRVIPGRVVQLGDPTGDGFGGSGRAPLPCETSPVPFLPLSVGMALSGRDTGSSQIFVTLSSQPELDGDYPLVGYADLEWHEVGEGEVIREVVVK